MLDRWESRDIFNRLRDKNRKGKPWSFLDGPITANNPMGVHHAWGRTLKDIFQRYHASKGFDLRYQNGFDCQGLWVEIEVEKELGFKSKRDVQEYGLEKFVKEASQVGVDGVIVPDLPNEESGNLRKLCESYGIYFIPLLAPTSTAERISHTCNRARGFIYCVQTTGVTGAREELSQDAASLVRAIRNHTSLPVLVGFGISNSEHVLNVGRFADGVIVGSALLDAIDRAPKDERLEVAVEFVRELVPTVT